MIAGARDVPLAGDHDHLGFRVRLLELANELDAVDIRQHHVGDDCIRLPRAEQFVPARADQCGAHLVARVLEKDFEPLGHRRLIIDGEYPFFTLDGHER